MTVAALALTGCGTAASVAPSVAADYTVEVEMLDIAFAPTELTVHVGDRVHFVFTNTGQIDHEAVIGDQAEQDGHEAENDGVAHPSHPPNASPEPNEIELRPGTTGTLDYTFTTPGTIFIGCHELAHTAAGMTMTISVEP